MDAAGCGAAAPGCGDGRGRRDLGGAASAAPPGGAGGTYASACDRGANSRGDNSRGVNSRAVGGSVRSLVTVSSAIVPDTAGRCGVAGGARGDGVG